MQKRPEEERPWAINIIRAPINPHLVRVKTPQITIAMWATDEYATNAFMSFSRQQIRPT